MQKKGWKEFLDLVSRANGENELHELLQLLLTLEEQEHLAMRTMLVKALLEGKQTQRDISKHLHISIAKITRGSNGLKQISSGLRKFLKRELLGE